MYRVQKINNFYFFHFVSCVLVVFPRSLFIRNGRRANKIMQENQYNADIQIYKYRQYFRFMLIFFFNKASMLVLC